MGAKYTSDAIENEKRGEARAKGEIKYSKTLRDSTGKQQPPASLKSAIAQFYKEIKGHPMESNYRAMLPSADNLGAIDSASPQQIKQWTNTFAQRKADYEQQIKAIAPAAQPKAVVPPASAVPTPSNPRATSAPVAAGTIERLGNRAKALSGYAEKSAGAAAALKAARAKLPETSRFKAQPPSWDNATKPPTPSDKADALIQKFDNQTTQATKDANKAVQSQVSQPSATSLDQLKPFDEVKAMEDQMRRGGYQIQEGGLKKDGAGYHVIDEKGRKLMVAPTAAMRSNVQDQMSGMNKVSNTLKPGQTMTDRASAIMGRAPQQTPQAGGVVTTDMRPVNTEQNPRGKVYMDALGNEFKEQTYRELDAKNGGAPLDPKMQTREYAHSMAAAADANSRQVQPTPLAASAPNPAGTVRRVLTDPKYGGSGVGYATETPKSNVTPEQYANRPQAPQPSTGNPAVVGTNSAVVAASPNVAAPTAASPLDTLAPKTPFENSMVSANAAAPSAFAGLAPVANATQAMRAQPIINAGSDTAAIQAQANATSQQNQQTTAAVTGQENADEEAKRKAREANMANISAKSDLWAAKNPNAPWEMNPEHANKRAAAGAY